MLSEIRKFIRSKEAYAMPIMLSLFLLPIFWNPTFVYSFTQGKELIFKTIAISTSVVFALSLFKNKKIIFNQVLHSPLFLLLLIQISLFAVTNALSDTPIISIHGTASRGFGFIMNLYLFAFLIYCALTLSQKTIKRMLKITFAGALIVAIYGILQKFGIDPFFKSYGTNIFASRSFSYLGNPSYLGQFMLLQTVIGAYLAINEKKISLKYIFWAGSILNFTALAFSGTRTALVGLAFVLILLSLKYSKEILNLLQKHKTKTLIIALICTLLFLVMPKDRYSFSKLALRSLNSRIEIWNGTLGLIKKHPIIGYGEENFYVYFPEIVNKKFLTLEENVSISADRIHNETLQIFFSHGIFALLIYLITFVFLLRIFFKSDNKLKTILSLVILANIIQNQFAFPDITISILIAFCYGGILSLSKKGEFTFEMQKYKNYLLGFVILILSFYVGWGTVFRPWMSQLAYLESKANYSVDYSIAINKHKEALSYTPYYSELWYELMFIDPSSMERALFYLEQIEGNSGNVLAWKGNFYAKTKPAKASDFYTLALNKNPYNPDWIRAFADMLYAQEDYENALFLYNKYLEAIPDFWEWKDELSQHSQIEQKSYESFLKQTPYFWGVIDKINKILDILDDSEQTP